MSEVIETISFCLIIAVVCGCLYVLARLEGESSGYSNGHRDGFLSSARGLDELTDIMSNHIDNHTKSMYRGCAKHLRDLAKIYPKRKAIVYKGHEKEPVDMDSKSNLVYIPKEVK